ncbi:hypothetical protein LCGC14_3045840, partial [marine sediment metagenome]
MKKKGFTLIELLVVISIIAMLLAILMPALGRVKEMAQRVVCATNCKGIGTTMMIYAADYTDNFPVAGGRGLNTWNPDGLTTASDNTAWMQPNFDWNGDDSLSIAASLYLLIKEVDGDPASFVCKSTDERPFINDGTGAVLGIYYFEAD